jgi:hypothetical protein
LFYQCLEKQLVLKNITSASEWPSLKQNIHFDYNRDNHFTELKEAELMQDRLNLLRDAEEYVGKYVSKEYIRRNILRQSDEDIDREDERIEAEKDAGGGDDDEGDLDFQSTTEPEEQEVTKPVEPIYLQNSLMKKRKHG